MNKHTRVVVGVDGSAGAHAALRFAIEEAAMRGTGVRVVSALLPPEYLIEAYGISAPPSVDEQKGELRLIARRMVDEVVAERPGLAVVPVELHEVVGRPAAVLIEQSCGADLLVVGHRGRGGFASAMLGSVGLQCVLHAPCPVTVVRPVVRAKETEREAGRRTTPADVTGGVFAPIY